MRILMVNTFHFPGGGDSTYTFNLAELLRSKGHTVAFFAMDDARNIPNENSDLFVSHIDFKELNRQKSLLGGLKVMRRVIYSTEARKKFGRLIERFKPDIVHLQNIHAHITPSVIFEAKAHSLPVVWTLHDFKLICPNTHFRVNGSSKICNACKGNSYYHAVLKKCKKNSTLASAMAATEAYAHRFMHVKDKIDAFLAPSAFLRGMLLKRGFSPEAVLHLPLFIPDSMFSHEKRSKGYLLFLGRVVAEKGILNLIEACKLAPETNVVIAGPVEGPLGEELPVLLPPNARYVGMKQVDEVKELLSGSSAVVVPSLWYENQPFSILEAFATGKPVIASDLGGMSELVRNSSGGLLVPPGDVKALAESMKWIVSHTEEAEEMGQVARNYTVETHSVQSHYDGLAKVYERVLN